MTNMIFFFFLLKSCYITHQSTFSIYTWDVMLYSHHLEESIKGEKIVFKPFLDFNN